MGTKIVYLIDYINLNQFAGMLLSRPLHGVLAKTRYALVRNFSSGNGGRKSKGLKTNTIVEKVDSIPTKVRTLPNCFIHLKTEYSTCCRELETFTLMIWY